MIDCDGYVHEFDDYAEPCPGPERCPTSKLSPTTCSACESPVDSPQHYYDCPEGQGYADPLRPPQPRLPAWDDPPKGRT